MFWILRPYSGIANFFSSVLYFIIIFVYPANVLILIDLHKMSLHLQKRHRDKIYLLNKYYLFWLNIYFDNWLITAWFAFFTAASLILISLRS